MPIRVAALSRWHVHADEYARAIQTHDDAERVALWDERPERERAWQEEVGTPFTALISQRCSRAARCASG
jgi:1,5-anhydro-D-fructose reductase (1,5-anhydro-D-mannitol-forming)